MSAGEAVITAVGLHKRHGAVVAVEDASFTLRQGRILCILGPSGCGKSSLLRLVAGLERADAGELKAGDQILDGAGIHVPPEQRRIGLVFQDLALFPHLSAIDNVTFGLRGLPAQARRQRARALLASFQLEHRAEAWPHQLSGGEQQRVAIARALAPEPIALLLDEPFSGLDGALRGRVREAVATSLRASGAAIAIVTHDPEEAMLLGDEIGLMIAGRIVQVGTPEDCYRRPCSAEAAALLGPVNAFPAQVSGATATYPLGKTATTITQGGATVLVRPEAIVERAAGVPATVESVAFGGSFWEVTLVSGAERFVMRTTGSRPTVRSEIRVGVLDGGAHVIADAR